MNTLDQERELASTLDAEDLLAYARANVLGVAALIEKEIVVSPERLVEELRKADIHLVELLKRWGREDGG